MKRSKGGGGESSGRGKSMNNKKKKKNRSPRSRRPPASTTTTTTTPPVIGTVATRTRHQKKLMASTWNQPVGILIKILTYVDPETLRMLCLVSKQFLDVIQHTPELHLEPLLQIICLFEKNEWKNQGDARIEQLLHRLFQIRDTLQNYRALHIINGHQFMCVRWQTIDAIARSFQLKGIVSLDVSSPSTATPAGNKLTNTHNTIMYALFKIVPNLHEVHFSNKGCDWQALERCSEKCTRLEKVTWNNCDRNTAVFIDGSDMLNATNLREIYMDDSVFYNYMLDEMADLEDASNAEQFLFHKCSSTVLERVSIRNARWYRWGDTVVIPQTALIKFVQKAPTSLRWFRSDLTLENILMLRSERPEIELVH